MTRPLRIAFARIAQESHALSPLRTTVDDFRRFHYLEGEALLRACGRFAPEARGFARNAELSGFVRAAAEADAVEPVPLFSAWAIPAGPLDAVTFAHFRDRLRADLRAAGPLDGLFLSLHGAMNADGVTDPEGELIAAAREVIGDRFCGATFDLHGLLTRPKVDGLDVCVAYRTNPHRDHAKVGRKAGALLIRALRGEIEPTSAWRSLPMLLGGGPTVDFMRPMRAVYAELDRIERDPRVLSTSLFMCHLWNNHPELGWSAHVTTDGDPALAERLAEEIADLAWSVKDEMPPTFLSPSEAITRVREASVRRRLGTVCVCDASDVVTAGAPGENTRLLEAFLREGRDLVTYIPLRDPIAIEELWGTPPGATVDITLGGRLDPARNTGLAVRGKIRAAVRNDIVGRMIALQIDRVTVVITEGIPAAIKPAFYTGLGLSIWKADAVVVKTFFPFRLFFLPYSRLSLYVKSEGLTDFDAAYVIDFADPMHPRDEVHRWRPADRRRRAVTG
ncbi:MAG: M81 family metallopeptidase [bacterium]